MKSLQYIISFFRYVAKPVVPKKLKQAGGSWFFLSLFVFSFLADLGLGNIVLCSYFAKLFHLVDAHTVEKRMLGEGLVFSAFVAGIVAPIAEEIRSRYYLTSFRWNYTVLPLGCCYFLLQCFHITNGVVFYTSIVMAAALALWLYIKLGASSPFRSRLLRYYSGHYSLFFYWSAFLFGATHLNNYQLENDIPVLSLILVIPQIFAGLILGYVRIVMGIKWSIVFHGLHNLLAVVILFLKP